MEPRAHIGKIVLTVRKLRRGTLRDCSSFRNVVAFGAVAAYIVGAIPVMDIAFEASPRPGRSRTDAC